MSETEKLRTFCEVLKVNEDLGLVFGWGMICTKNGEPYYDLGGIASPGVSDHIPEPVMLSAATDFMVHSRTLDDSHDFEDHGTVVHSMPMTKEIAEVYGLEIGDTTGWMVAVRPAPDVLSKFKDGTYKGFSIGGTIVREAENGG